MTEVELTPAAQAEPPADPWVLYLAAARQLDGIRRSAATAVAEQTQTVQAARAELDALNRRVAVQRAALPGRGVPAADLDPTPTELAAAAQAVAGGPGAVLAAVRGARATADAADAQLVGAGPAGSAAWTPWLRNLLVYGPFAAVVLLVQLALYLTAAANVPPAYALLCGLTMPVAAFGLGWLTIGLVFRTPGTATVDRTPVLGAVVCLAPVVVTCMGVGLLALLR